MYVPKLFVLPPKLLSLISLAFSYDPSLPPLIISQPSIFRTTPARDYPLHDHLWSLVPALRHPLEPIAQALRLYVARFPRHWLWSGIACFGFPAQLYRLDHIPNIPWLDGGRNLGEWILTV